MLFLLVVCGRAQHASRHLRTARAQSVVLTTQACSRRAEHRRRWRIERYVFECTWVGCPVHAHRCDADHVLPFSHAGPTSAGNGAPLCDHHNPWKNKGYRTWRDPDGRWHTYRPDGSELGWPAKLAPPAA